MMKFMKKFFFFFLLSFLTLFQTKYAVAQDTDRGEFLLKYNKKIEMPAKFTAQYYETETVSFALKDMYTNPKYINTQVLTKRPGEARIKTFKALRKNLTDSKCDYNKILEVRYVDPIDLACDVVKPLEGDAIQYNAITESVYLDELTNGMKIKPWKRTGDYSEAKMGLLVEFEITNSVNAMVGGRQVRMLPKNRLQRYEEYYLLGLKITGVDLNPEASDKIIFKAHLMKPLLEYPSEETLKSLMNEVGKKIGKQKSYGYIRGHSLKFNNYEKVDK